MGSRRGFICRMKLGNVQPDVQGLQRLRQRNALGPSPDGSAYAVVHCTGYIKNWPPSGECLYRHRHLKNSCYCPMANRIAALADWNIEERVTKQGVQT